MTGATEKTEEIYQFRFRVIEVCPMIWRRIHVASESSISDLHYIIQICMGWDDDHLHQFRIRGKRYGISQPGGICFDNGRKIPLSQFGFRERERFQYEYNFFSEWKLEVRFEKRVDVNPKRSYPFCIGGAQSAPPEECSGAWSFMELKQEHTRWRIMGRIQDAVEKKDLAMVEEVLEAMEYWLYLDRFDRKTVNSQLKRYGQGVRFWDLDTEAYQCA